MAKFKVGEYVRCNDKGSGVKGGGWELGKVFKIATMSDAFNCSRTAVCSDKDYNLVCGSYLELATKTLDDLELGDIIEDNVENKRKILGRLNDLIFPSEIHKFNTAAWAIHIDELKKLGYKVVQPEPVKETMITVKGKEYSEDTLHKAIKEYVK